MKLKTSNLKIHPLKVIKDETLNIQIANLEDILVRTCDIFMQEGRVFFAAIKKRKSYGVDFCGFNL